MYYLRILSCKYFTQCALLALVAGFSNAALSFDLAIPVDCDYGNTCIISNYVDTNPVAEEAPQDYSCGDLTYEGSTSTRFMVKDVLEMRKGVSVLAAEDGEVLYVRDGIDDISVDLTGGSTVRGRECGNGVIIKHRRSFITEYCHMMKGSILVEVGDKVRKGLRIGLVGISGKASYPQLGFTVKRGEDFYDPFLGDEDLRCGSLKAYPLWDRRARKTLAYIPTTLLNAHFVDKVPFAIGAREGKFRKKKLSATSDKMVFWADIFGVREGDKLILQIVSPSGRVLNEELRTFPKHKERHFQFVGEVLKSKRWEAGQYEGVVRLIRPREDDEAKAVLDKRIPILIEG